MGKEKENSEVKIDPNAWMITFGDLLMLLLTFFVLLLTMKSMDAGALTEFFGRFTETGGPMEFSKLGPGGETMMGGDRPVTSEMIASSERLRKVMDVLEGVERQKERDRRMTEIRELLDISEDRRGVVVTLNSDPLFESASAELSPGHLKILDGVGKLLRHADNDILVMGHTDNRPVRSGPFESNWELSVYRALNVIYYLTDNLELRPGRMGAGGYGDRMPRYPNDTEENRAKNRRVEFILRKPFN